MNEKRAREILGKIIDKNGEIQPEEGVYCRVGATSRTRISNGIRLDGFFSISELEAIVWWMKNKGKK